MMKKYRKNIISKIIINIRFKGVPASLINLRKKLFSLIFQTIFFSLNLLKLIKYSFESV